MAIILSVTPYKFMPSTNGGHWGVYIVEKILSVFNDVHTIGTKDNFSKIALPFHTHFILPTEKWRYFPFSQYKKVMKVAREVKPGYIFCHHHYMHPMVRKIASELGIPLYIRCHNIESERFRSTGKWWWRAMYIFEKTAFRQADNVFFVTEEDRQWAIDNYGLSEEKAVVMPFGIDFSAPPSLSRNSRQIVADQYKLNRDVPWLFFMGQLDYGPNEVAVKHIIRDILPALKKVLPEFHILICGKKLNPSLCVEIDRFQENKEISYLGFVPEIETIIEASDMMLNPVVSGGGVKTKVVESLAWGKTVVSSFNGARGIETAVCGDKLLILPENQDWEQFVQLIKKGLLTKDDPIPQKYFNYYYSGNIAERMQRYFST